MGVWLFIGIVTALTSPSAPQAALRTFLFFLGMVGSYFLYTVLVGGFFPKAYMLFWFAITIFTPLGGFVCFYARGEHPVSICLSALLVALMARQAFGFGFWYFDILYSGLEAVLWVVLLVLLYRSPRQILLSGGGGLLLFLLTSQLWLGGLL